jgi:L-fuconolactonase
VNIDAHQHFWDPAREPLPWMTAEHAVIDRAFAPADLKPSLDACGVDRTVLVQAVCSDSDTAAMLAQATAHEWIGAVVAWVPLETTARARARLDELVAHPRVRGVRHLIHDEADPHWILRPRVLESIALLEQHGLILELPCVFPRHLGDVPGLARRFPRLTIVIDHLGKPPIGTAEMARWEAEIRAAAAAGNVAAKVSGLTTALASGDWSAEDLRAPIQIALECFGPERLLCGSDWPVSLLSGGYARVWGETVRAVEAVARDDAAWLFGATAARLYALSPQSSEPGTTGGRAH